MVPLLLTRGYHVKQDIPELAATAPVHARVAPPLGPHPLLVETLYDRLVEAGWHTGPRGASAVVLAAAGSRDPESKLDTLHTAHLLAARLGVPVIPAYASAATPRSPRRSTPSRPEATTGWQSPPASRPRAASRPSARRGPLGSHRPPWEPHTPRWQG